VSRIVTTTSRKRARLLSAEQAAEPDDDEAKAVRAWLRAREMGSRASELTRSTVPGRGNAMPQPPPQEQQPISAMDFLRGTPGQFRAHKQLPVEPEPVRRGRIRKRIRKLVWAIFGFWTLTVVGAFAYLQLTVYAGQIQRAANSAQVTPALSSGGGDATPPAQEPPSALNAVIDDTAAPSTPRPLHPSIQLALTAPVFQAFAPDDAFPPPTGTATELSVAPSDDPNVVWLDSVNGDQPLSLASASQQLAIVSLPSVATPDEVLATSPQVLSAATAPVAPPPVSAVSGDGATLHAPIPPKPPPSAAPVASAPQLDPGLLPLLLSRGNAMLALGDISAARLLYERATALGSAGAATRLGNTYDAGFLASIQARGIVADQAAAIAWYRKAAVLGDTEAVHQLERFAPAQ
jgi:hypothetical protein